jgi:formyl-CoA transferase
LYGQTITSNVTLVESHRKGVPLMTATRLVQPPALDGIVVLDLGQIYNAPYCTHLLRHLGAEVIKIEPFAGDPIRWRSDQTSSGQAFALLNAGKKSLRLDLKSPQGHALMLRLVAGADVVVENFAPGTMGRLGLDWQTLSGVNPRIVLASGSGYGSYGPNAELRGMDITVQAMTAVLATTGFPDQPPVKAGPAVADFSGGTHLACAVLAALFQRERTGSGQRVEVSMQDAVLPMLTSNLAGLLESDGEFPDRTGNRHGGLSVCPYNVYPTSDGWLAILCLRTRHWHSLCELMGLPDLAEDTSAATPAGRVARMDEIDERIGHWTATMATAEAFDLVQRNDIPAAPVRTLRELLDDPHLRERGMLRHVGADTVLGSPLVLGDSAPQETSPAPELGADTDEILAGVPGLSPDDIAGLREHGAV